MISLMCCYPYSDCGNDLCFCRFSQSLITNGTYLQVPNVLFGDVTPNCFAAVEGVFLRHRAVQRRCLTGSRHFDVHRRFVPFPRYI